MNTIIIPMLLEARIDGAWCSFQIVYVFSSVRSALDWLPTFTRQQKIDLEDVRVKALRTEEQVTAAEQAVSTYNTGRE